MKPVRRPRIGNREQVLFLYICLSQGQPPFSSQLACVVQIRPPRSENERIWTS